METQAEKSPIVLFLGRVTRLQGPKSDIAIVMLQP